MADEDRAQADGLGDAGGTAFLDALERAPGAFDFFQALRRIECQHPDKPRLGEAVRAHDEVIRLGQDPMLAFAPSTIASTLPAQGDTPRRLLVNFFGLLGPNGPLPLHLTEYARDRLRNADDPAMARFFDVFNHRMLLLLYRAWANGEPTVSRDRPASDRFATFVASLAGRGLPSLANRDAFPDGAKLFYVGHLARQTHNAEGLRAMIGDFFRMPVEIEEFIGNWLDLPADNRWALGRAPQGRLGYSAVLGSRIWDCQHKFRVRLGPLNREQFDSMLPGGKGLPLLRALVRNYTGDELAWDLRLILDQRTENQLALGRSRLGFSSWLSRGAGGWRQDLILDPQ
jgi:type VI secretion system protein ImpH